MHYTWLKKPFWVNLIRKSPSKNIHEPWLFSIPAVILGLLIPIIFFIPNLFTQHIVIPALRSVSQLGTEVEAIAPHVSQWHGINLPLILPLLSSL